MDAEKQRVAPRRGFSLTELLVVIGIIVGLIALLLPMIGKLRGRAYEASTNAMVAQISAGFDNYYNVFHAYPGPLSNAQLATWTIPQAGPSLGYHDPVTNTNANTLPDNGNQRITVAENAVLGLLGGLEPTGLANPPFRFNPDLVGKGPRGLNVSQPKKYDEFMTSASISAGHYKDSADQDANDSVIPELVDGFPEQMPFLILRANPGRTSMASPPDPADNSVITDGSGQRTGHYDISQVLGYTGAFSGNYPNLTLNNARYVTNSSYRSIGVGKDLPNVCQAGDGNMVGWKSQVAYHGLNFVDPDSMNSTLKRSDAVGAIRYYYPYDAYAYITNNSLPVRTTAAPTVINSPRQKDRYIIISAGKDRVYGTDDDITNFGSVAP